MLTKSLGSSQADTLAPQCLNFESLFANLCSFAHFAVNNPFRTITAKNAKGAKVTQRVEVRSRLRRKIVDTV
jgi:hypothetical protein